MATSCKLLGLPGEIREAIYHEILFSPKNKYDIGNEYKKYRFDLSVFRTCHQIYSEARAVFRRDNIFVAVDTPWPDAQNYVGMEGYVPIVVSGEKALRFNNVHLRVQITPQFAALDEADLRRFILTIDDLASFTYMWYHSNLSHPGMNEHLRLILKLQDPYQLAFEDKPIPKAIQRKLLEPFGLVKNLYQVVVQGDHYASVEKTMREQMAVPYPTVEKCLEESTRLKDEGNDALRKGQYQDALRLYRESHRHLMIICEGRRRSVWGDAYFHVQCREGQFKDQFAQIVRLVLRVRLVSNTVMAYLKLNNYEEAAFWGMRTIKIFQESIQQGDEARQDFPAAPEIGKIYYRTGVACRELGDKPRAYQMMKVAKLYLPHDTTVAKDFEALKQYKP
ncbi:hypothetical protein B0O99DRAFT_684395 [Bisporella sp. PMI_857]|nr:hypothetical protein B0O99DRAFT_684395 [Bisporella sp. PMI_857]